MMSASSIHIRSAHPWLRAFATTIVFLASIAMTACGSGGGGGGGDVPTFYLADSTPNNGNTNVPTNQVVSVIFNKKINIDTVTPLSVAVVAAGTGAIQGTLSVAPSGERELRWVPSELMVAGKVHTCTISSDVRAADGDSLGGLVRFDFRTRSADAGPPVPDARRLRNTGGPMVEGRQSHTATLLSDGRVLIAGGFDGGTHATDRAEFYRPFTDSFIATSTNMLSERAGHTATKLADGRVLICGGFKRATAGGLTANQSAELFDPQLGSFLAVGNMTAPRANQAAVLLDDGRVLLTGGSNYLTGPRADLSSAEVYDPATQTFAALSTPMLFARGSHVALKRPSGDVVLIGGSNGDFRVSLFNPTNETFTDMGLPAAASARFGSAASHFASGTISVAGGNVTGSVLNVVPDASIPGNTFAQNTGSPLWRARSYATSSLIAPDTLLVVGGIDFTRGNIIESSTDIIVEGGIGGSRTYSTSMRFPTGMAAHTATVLSNGDVLFCGGLDVAGTSSLSAAYIYEVP